MKNLWLKGFLYLILIGLIILLAKIISIPRIEVVKLPKAYAAEIPPILKKIAVCESGGKQFNSDGSVVRGRINRYDVGRFQINLLYHQEQATKLGYDLMSEQGNTAFALWLYEHQGTKPWGWSNKCWKG